MVHQGLMRTYRLHISPSYSAAKPAALVFALHGGGGNARGMEKLTDFTPISDREGFIIVYPEALNGLWKDGVQRTQQDRRNIDDVGYIATLIDTLSKELAIDTARVYATGISNGGHMSNRLATELSNRLAAIGVVGATMEKEYANSHSPDAPVSVIYFHGTADPLRYFGGGGKAGGNTLAARSMTEWWVEKNGCPTTALAETLPDLTDDGTRVKREIYNPCRENSEVAFYTIENGGHTWPGGLQYLPENEIGKTSRDINASELMWKFFSQHSRLNSLTLNSRGAQRESNFVFPKETDSQIDLALEAHYVALNKSSKPRNQLLLFFPGTNAVPRLYQELSNTAADLGFYVINLRYVNDHAVNTLCGGANTDLDCYEKVRLEIIDGTDRTPLVTVDRANSVENRLIKLIQHLQRNYPNDQWEQFLQSDGNIRWESIVTAGHSQGGGHAAILGKYHKLARVIMFAAMDFNGRLRQPANWIGSNNATPAAEYYAFSHQRDTGVNYTTLSTIVWPKYGLDAFGSPVNVDTVVPPYNRSHALTSNADTPSGNYHSTIAADPFLTKQPDGTPVYQPVWKYLLTAISSAHSLHLAQASTQPTLGDSRGSLVFENRPRSYLLHVPPKYDGQAALPLVLFLHGGGGSAQGAASTYGLSTKADRENFIVVYPDGTGQLGDRGLTWNTGHCCGYALQNNINDVGFLKALIEKLQKELKIDSKRIYVTGHSNGGMMSYRLGAELSDILAAIAPVAGSIGGVAATGVLPYVIPPPTQPISVIAFHGQLDENVKYTGGHGNNTSGSRSDTSVAESIAFWVRANQCAPTAKTEISASQNIIRDAYAPCANSTEVVLYSIANGGHAWPGSTRGDKPTQEISAVDLLWDFFKTHPKN
jgi:polyhydroxybutyrate depolymerase